MDPREQKLNLNLLDTHGVATMLGKSTVTITEYRRTGGLPFIRIVGARRDTIRFDKQAVESWWQERSERRKHATHRTRVRI